jgi:hypothetical protein
MIVGVVVYDGLFTGDTISTSPVSGAVVGDGDGDTAEDPCRGCERISAKSSAPSLTASVMVGGG